MSAATDPRPGWCGLASQLLYFLGTVGADRDEHGLFLVGPKGTIAVGYGGDEVVVGPDAVYFVNGQPHGLASNLGGTSYGIRPVVFGCEPHD